MSDLDWQRKERFLSAPDRRPRACLVWAVALAVLAGCEEAPKPADPPAKFQPAPPALPRLTRAQYDDTVRDVLGAGLTLPAALEPDVAFDHLLTVGAAVAKVSPRGIELYEEAARSLAAQVAGKPSHLQQLLPCALPDQVTWTAAPAQTACLDQLADQVGRRLWRRPLQPTERAALVAAGQNAAQQLGTLPHGAQAILTRLLQSPHFLYRPEVGEPDPQQAGGRRATGLELATKLAYFLWNGPPDEALLAAAPQLHDPQVRAAQVDRLMADPRLRRAVRNFATEWLQLHQLPKLSKDPKVYKHFAADLGGSAREEALRLVEHVALDTDADLRTLLTTRTTFVDRRLAAIYEIQAPAADGHHQVQLPEASERRGLLGQVAFLGLAAHATSSSPTLRGIFVRRFLMCEGVPDPPANLNTAIPEPGPGAKTMRQRLVAHMAVPQCASCHQRLDPVGLGFERFDGIGRYRLQDLGEPIDTTGELDGRPFVDAVGLGQALAASPAFAACVVQKVYAYAAGRPLAAGEQPELDRLTARFAKDGYRLKALLREVALSQGLARVQPLPVAK